MLTSCLSALGSCGYICFSFWVHVIIKCNTPTIQKKKKGTTRTENNYCLIFFFINGHSRSQKETARSCTSHWADFSIFFPFTSILISPCLGGGNWEITSVIVYLLSLAELTPFICQYRLVDMSPMGSFCSVFLSKSALNDLRFSSSCQQVLDHSQFLCL